MVGQAGTPLRVALTDSRDLVAHVEAFRFLLPQARGQERNASRAAYEKCNAHRFRQQFGDGYRLSSLTASRPSRSANAPTAPAIRICRPRPLVQSMVVSRSSSGGRVRPGSPYRSHFAPAGRAAQQTGAVVGQMMKNGHRRSGGNLNMLAPFYARSADVQVAP